MKITGTAEDETTACDRGNVLRSEQSTSKLFCANAIRAPSDIAVEPATALGVALVIRSA